VQSSAAMKFIPCKARGLSIQALLLLSGSALAASCEPLPRIEGDEPSVQLEDPSQVERVSQALVVNTYNDDSIPGIHVQVKECTTDGAAKNLQSGVGCTLDSGYALVGGGAWAKYSGNGALLWESRPLFDMRTWQASSKDHGYADPHQLTVYAVGLRLDGLNAAVLRNKLSIQALTGSSAAHPSTTVTGVSGMLGGGARANWTGAGQLLTNTWPATDTSWTASSKDHMYSSPGTTTAYAIKLPTAIIEEFGGALDRQQKSSPGVYASSGVALESASVDAGWALAGYGATTDFNAGTDGRLLFKVGPQGTSARAVEVRSKDHGSASGGWTRARWTQVRKTPDSHGMCQQGGKLNPNMDTCVAAVCQVDPFCCNNWWDQYCVAETTSVCGRSCVEHTCQAPSFQPSYWTNRTLDNCYNYATNKATGTVANPGKASGDACNPYGDPTCGNLQKLTERAIADGLVPTTKNGVCPGGQSKVALWVWPNEGFHWVRQDANGTWSHKNGSQVPSDRDFSNQPILDPELADFDNAQSHYTQFGGYFCTCSSATEGAGHAVIE
jgi:hypothetical protein